MNTANKFEFNLMSALPGNVWRLLDQPEDIREQVWQHLQCFSMALTR